MKTKLIMKSATMFVILIFAVSISFAAAGPRKTAGDLKTIISKSVTYPEYAKENKLSGFVVLSFTVDENGKISIQELNTNSVYFQLYVEKKLSELTIENPGAYAGKTHYYRFDFELVG
ncbi:MAG TPA: hypothetical protein PKW80_14945 [Bacteroidales bacterium]|nr:hypothetical protein [Bacteroidales bacterium]